MKLVFFNCIAITSCFFSVLSGSEERRLPKIIVKVTNNNSNVSEVQQSSAQKHNKETNILLDPRLLELTNLVKTHWLTASYGTIAVGAVGSYCLLIAYIVRNKSWIHYNDTAWHAWRIDVVLDVLKQIQPSLTAQELWKAMQNKYPGKPAGEILTLFINDTSKEIDRLETFIATCNKLENFSLTYITPTITQTRTLATEKLLRLHLMQQTITSRVVAALTT